MVVIAIGFPLSSIRARRGALACLLLICVFAGCLDRREVFFGTRKLAEEAGEIGGVWIPGELPTSSREIRAIYDFDTGELWGRFVFRPSEGPEFRTKLRAGGVRIQPSCPRRRDRRWWSDFHERVNRLRLYRGAGAGNTYFAIDWQRGEAFYWRCAS
jgi:hypothetical protein